MSFKVQLVSLGNAVDSATQASCTTALKKYFDDVVAEYDSKYVGKGSKFVDSDVSWVSSLSNVGATDIVIYFVKYSSDSVAKDFNSAVNGSGNGVTFPTTGSPVVSEVYATNAAGKTDVGAALAALAFHESMHNKLRMDDATLHGLNGRNGAGSGLSSDPISATYALTAPEKTEMAKHLNDKVAQWTGGIDAWSNPSNGH